MKEKKANCFWTGFVGVATFLILIIVLNLMLGNATTNSEINNVCLEHIGKSAGNLEFEITKTPHSNFCYQIAKSTINSYTYLNPPKYIGEIECQGKTYFWESKQCVLFAGETE